MSYVFASFLAMSYVGSGLAIGRSPFQVVAPYLEMRFIMPKVNYELEQVGEPDSQNLQKAKKEKSEKNPAITIASFLPSYNDPLTT
jgi:hypothetical protein